MNIGRPIVAIVGPFQFPRGGAAARRVLGNALMLSEIGYDVIIAAGQKEKSNRLRSINKFIKMISINERKAEKCPTLIKHLLYINMGKLTVKWLDNLEIKPKAVILYSGYSPYLLRLVPWCRKNGIPLIFDAVEWYQPNHLQGGGCLGPYRWNIELAMKILAVKANNIIAISRYLQKYYDSKKCQTVRIPPTLDTVKIVPRIERMNREKIVLCYAGNPGKKDLIIPLLQAMKKIDPDGRRLELQIVGVDEDEFRSGNRHNRDLDGSIIDKVRFYGKMTYRKTWEIVRNADYSVVIRKPLRYAQAGFPTKVVESLALGTPVLCNITSDLGSYIHDGMEGIVSESWRANDIMNCLKRIMNTSEAKIVDMRKSARRCAVENFDFRKYKEKMLAFMKKLPNGGGIE